MKIKAATEYFLQNQDGMISPETVRNYKYTVRFLINHFGEDRPIDSITKLDAEKFRSYLLSYKRFSEGGARFREDGKTLSPATVRRVVKNARRIFSWLQDMEEIDRNPFLKTKLPAEDPNPPEDLDPRDFDKLVDECQMPVKSRAYDEKFRVRDTAILYFLASTGCRVSGIASTQLCDLKIFDGRGETTVREKYTGGGKIRTVYLSETATIAIMEWLEVRPQSENHDFLFVSLSSPHIGKPMKKNAFAKVLGRLRDRVNERAKHDPDLDPITDPVSPHRFRRTCARHWIQQGMTEGEVAQILGNTIEVVREHYARFYKHELQNMHSKVSWIERR